GLVSIQKLARLARKARFTILAASVPSEIQNSFRNAKLIGEDPGQLRVFRDRDFSIEWCENEILQREITEKSKETRNLPQILNDFHPWETDTSVLFNYLERQEVGKNHYLMLQGD